MLHIVLYVRASTRLRPCIYAAPVLHFLTFIGHEHPARHVPEMCFQF